MVLTPTPIYHFTHVRNLVSILQMGELLSPNRLRQTTINPVDIAYDTVQTRRAYKIVPCGPRGVIHDYVPFYFAPRSPMLYTISRGNVQSYAGGQTPLIHFVSSVQLVERDNLPFVFTDGHGIIDYTNFYADLAYLDQIDWDLMRERYWANTAQDNDRVRRRQAEFLVYKACPWQLITEIGVISRDSKMDIVRILETSSHKPRVSVHPEWYF